MKKVVLVAFNGDPMCFVHVLLNALDMKARGFEARLVIEGAATRLIAELDDPERPFHGLYRQVREQGLVDCVCHACATKTGSLEKARRQGLPLCTEMSGHPSLGRYLEAGWEVMAF
ncbi:MAG: cytoplasmic protein [Desulfobacterales bacterium]